MDCKHIIFNCDELVRNYYTYELTPEAWEELKDSFKTYDEAGYERLKDITFDDLYKLIQEDKLDTVSWRGPHGIETDLEMMLYDELRCDAQLDYNDPVDGSYYETLTAEETDD